MSQWARWVPLGPIVSLSTMPRVQRTIYAAIDSGRRPESNALETILCTHPSMTSLELSELAHSHGVASTLAIERPMMLPCDLTMAALSPSSCTKHSLPLLVSQPRGTARRPLCIHASAERMATARAGNMWRVPTAFASRLPSSVVALRYEERSRASKRSFSSASFWQGLHNARTKTIQHVGIRHAQELPVPCQHWRLCL